MAIKWIVRLGIVIGGYRVKCQVIKESDKQLLLYKRGGAKLMAQLRLQHMLHNVLVIQYKNMIATLATQQVNKW